MTKNSLGPSLSFASVTKLDFCLAIRSWRLSVLSVFIKHGRNSSTGCMTVSIVERSVDVHCFYSTVSTILESMIPCSLRCNGSVPGHCLHLPK